ncbi:SH3 domain-containing protein [Anaerobacillus sp. HL2]|nr:SH3 domain-containing protein [Anaerobacillus sp. HL2]
MNVRQGPKTADAVVGKLSKNQTATIVGSQSEWLKISFDQVEGFIHSGYVQIIDYYGQSTRGLVTPTYEKEAERSQLSWWS